MTWREERKSDLEQRLEKTVKLLGECEQNLIDESDPIAKSKLNSQICKLKEEMGNCQHDLDSLEQEDGTQRSSSLTMANINYDDINFVITALLNQRMVSINSQDNFQPTDPEGKMSKNDLTHEIKFVLGMGLAKAGEVRHFIENIAKINFPDVPERLKASLNAEYIKLMNSGVRGDDLFNRLYSFSHQNNPNPSRQLAGLAVLCYFFETCDVFEP
jgi:hypothetical protein